MAKVKLTQKQADEIERVKRIGFPTRWKNNGWYIERDEALNGLSFYQYLNAIFKGYEVIPEFKEHDYVVYLDEIGKLIKKDGQLMFESRHYNVPQCIPFNHLRHATPIEEAEEKTIRWWNDLDRAPWELAEKDMLEHYGIKLEVVQVDYMKEYVLSNGKKVCRKTFSYPEYRVICFADQRLDV